ncbi:uncharacterized protein [Drosophila pseudoobscura]|uniref:Uncharacterized protein isoform X8 n=1 Tax=Drosophila pseudoobscura pseudoobscura TaxID=46245 RepID=A0A6I8W7L8_DROPS|nr:uncharacterized protein LOC26533050 isoform X8 [Drosophila pseudoobscura]
MVILQTREGHRDGTWNIRSVIPPVRIPSGLHQYQKNIMQRDQNRINHYIKHYIKHREREGRKWKDGDPSHEGRTS